MRLQWAPVKKRAGKAAAHLPVHMIKLTDARDHALCLGASERGGDPNNLERASRPPGLRSFFLWVLGRWDLLHRVEREIH